MSVLVHALLFRSYLQCFPSHLNHTRQPYMGGMGLVQKTRPSNSTVFLEVGCVEWRRTVR